MSPTGSGRRGGLLAGALAGAAVGAVLSLGCSGEPENRPAETEEVRLVTWKPNQPDLWEEVYRLFERREDLREHRAAP